MRNFYLKKRMWRCLWVLKNFPVILPEKWWWKWWFGGAGRRAWRSKESVQPKMKKKKRKKRKVREWADQRNEKMSDCVVGRGLGGAWHVGTQNKYLILIFFFFFLCVNWVVTNYQYIFHFDEKPKIPITCRFFNEHFGLHRVPL